MRREKRRTVPCSVAPACGRSACPAPDAQATGTVATAVTATATVPTPAATPPAPAAAVPAGDAVSFVWPAQGAVVSSFDEARNKGVAIAGKVGDPVLAANRARVAAYRERYGI